MGRSRKNVSQIKQVTVSTKITVPMLKQLNRYLQQSAYVTMADYLRDLVRKDLESKGYKLSIDSDSYVEKTTEEGEK